MEFLIHPEELSERWVGLAKKHGLKRISLHPRGGKRAHQTLSEMLDMLEEPSYRNMIDDLIDGGVEVGYEFHAASYLLPRELYDTHPEYFRMDVKLDTCSVCTRSSPVNLQVHLQVRVVSSEVRWFVRKLPVMVMSIS